MTYKGLFGCPNGGQMGPIQAGENYIHSRNCDPNKPEMPLVLIVQRWSSSPGNSA